MKKLMFRIQKRIQKKLRVSEIEAESKAKILINSVVSSLVICLIAIFYFYIIFIEVDGNLTSGFGPRMLIVHWFTFSSILFFPFFSFWTTGKKTVKTSCADRKSRLPLERRRHLFLPAVFFVIEPD